MTSQHFPSSHSPIPSRPTDILPESQRSSFSTLLNWDGRQSTTHSMHQAAPAQPASDTVTNDSKEKLAKFYNTRSKKPTYEERLQLACDTGFSTEFITRWFSHQREADSAWNPATQDIMNTKPRTKFTESQKASMEAYFSRNTYPNAEERKQLANSLRLDTEAIDNWSVLGTKSLYLLDRCVDRFSNKRKRSRARN
ncbi:hypothetical protein L227DRAFT_618021 [Lentinus tigrinus ALCF2SS1-6]|uniref:Homeobox domain-containing protein n=1 Tax=Lentinus tigrinus ALCF2SS1-6 TaxID=1328759 RepID=A0A5C2RKL8_9APHY|nr:hypothetical protein L227DRAFT_618021 [Lentinus tigrinus ALCF2SS1-6]